MNIDKVFPTAVVGRYYVLNSSSEMLIEKQFSYLVLVNIVVS